MCVATSIIVAGIAAGGTLAGAKISSNAAKNAAKTQADAGDKALAFQREQYQQARSDFSPYQQASSGALGRLNLEAGIGRPAFRPGQPQPAAPEAFGSAARQLGAPIGLPPAAAPPNVGPGPARLFQQTAAPPAAPSGGPLWTLQAPDGTTAQYPADVAPQFISKGARRVA